MEQNKDQFQRGQQGSGSAENMGKSRDEQVNRTEDLSKQQKTDVAAQMGKGPNPIRDIEDMGKRSGRDDYAGGFGDGMSGQSTGEPTKKP